MALCRFRHPEAEDRDIVVRIRDLSKKELPEHRSETRAEVDADLFTKDFDPKGCWMAFRGADAVAYGVGIVDEERTSAGRLEGRVEIEVLREGIYYRKQL